MIGPGEVYALSCAVAWAAAVILFKKSGESLAPFALNLFKNALSLLLLGVTLWLTAAAWPGIPPSALLLMLLSGVLGIGLGDTLYFHALNTIGASRMAVAQTLYSPFVVLLSMIFLGERLHWGQGAGVLLVLGGILLVTYARQAARRADAARTLRGVGQAALAMLLMAAGIVMAKPLLERYDFLWVVALRIAGGLAGMLVEAALLGRFAALPDAYRRVRHWPQVVAGAVVGSYLSMMLWLAGYKYTQASIAAVLNELAAVFILGFAIVFLGERPAARQIAGVMVAVSGVAMVIGLR